MYALSTFIRLDELQVELIDPAVKGTLNVLKTCAKVSSVKRVVITSSMATVQYTRKTLTPDVVVDETWYSDPEVCKELKVCFASETFSASFQDSILII